MISSGFWWWLSGGRSKERRGERGDGGARGEGLGFWSWGEGAAGGCFIQGKMWGERPVRGMALGCDSDVRALVRTKEGDGRQRARWAGREKGKREGESRLRPF